MCGLDQRSNDGRHRSFKSRQVFSTGSAEKAFAVSSSISAWAAVVDEAGFSPVKTRPLTCVNAPIGCLFVDAPDSLQASTRKGTTWIKLIFILTGDTQHDFPLLWGAPPSISCAVRACSNESTVPTRAASLH
jgi:hypothetical protein